MILSLLIFLPLLAAAIAYTYQHRARLVALTTVSLMIAVGIWSMFAFDMSQGYQLREFISWVDFGMFSIEYHVAVDGISYPLLLLTLVLALVAVMISSREVHTKEGAHYALLLLTLSGVIGVFVSLNLVIFFLFWELVLVGMFLLILMWGLSNRRYAAMKFLVYTGIGSGAILLAIIVLATVSGTADLILLQDSALSGALRNGLFLLFLFGFFVKLPIVPFHTWLPDAHVQAPSAGSVLLAGVLLKMGGYGLLRIGLTVLPEPSHSMMIFLFIMGTVTLLYAGFVCFAQTNIKSLIAYSSINHMGLVVLGVAAGSSLGIAGAVFEMVSHGLISALLFGLAGLIHQKTGTFSLEDLKGLSGKMPRTAWLLLLGALAAMGLPGFSGFIAEIIVFFAIFQSFGLIALIPIAGVIVSGSYIVRLIAKTVLGKGTIGSEEGVNFTPFVLLLVFSAMIGIAPFLLLGLLP